MSVNISQFPGPATRPPPPLPQSFPPPLPPTPPPVRPRVSFGVSGGQNSPANVFSNSSSPSNILQQQQLSQQSPSSQSNQQAPVFKDLPLMKLANNAQQREYYDNLADLFSLIVTTEHIETAYVRDSISNKDYTKTCGKLIAQYKTLKEAMGKDAPDLDAFCQDYGLNCRAAINRFKVGVPATILHGDIDRTSNSAGKEITVFHCVQHFITAMDSLKLNMKAVDELYPNINDLMDSINKVPNLPPEHEARVKVRAWLVTLSSMRAHEELKDDQARQMSFDLDAAYNAFHKFVEGK